MSVEIGLKGRAEETVTDANTGSGRLLWRSARLRYALYDRSDGKCGLDLHRPPPGAGESTVGTAMNITHISASPVGIRVWAESEVTLVDGKRIELKVAAYDQTGKIGEGTHQRFIVTDDRFLAKAARKLEG